MSAKPKPLTVPQRVLHFITTHPGSTTQEIGAGVGVSASHAAVAARRMEYLGRLRSETMVSGGQRRVIFYPTGYVKDAALVVAKARQIGGHFGILVAQMT